MPTETQLSKWGNSLAIRIPLHLAKDAGLVEGDQLDLKLNKQGQIVLRPARPRYKLSELLARVTPENRHGETDWGPPVGKEHR